MNFGSAKDLERQPQERTAERRATPAPPQLSVLHGTAADAVTASAI